MQVSYNPARAIERVHCAGLNAVIMVDHYPLGQKPRSFSLLLQDAGNFDGCL